MSHQFLNIGKFHRELKLDQCLLRNLVPLVPPSFASGRSAQLLRRSACGTTFQLQHGISGHNTIHARASADHQILNRFPFAGSIVSPEQRQACTGPATRLPCPVADNTEATICNTPILYRSRGSCILC